ncbi:hypothetical protein TNCV_1891381 [Trichonephila clavipes]|nr:hypothetical protein TNCV_1891381 [Trichonephila clavipes]
MRGHGNLVAMVAGESQVEALIPSKTRRVERPIPAKSFRTPILPANPSVGVLWKFGDASASSGLSLNSVIKSGSHNLHNFSSNKNFLIKIEHSTVIMADRSSHECLKCGQGYPTARELLIHEVLHYDNVKPVPIFALTKLPPSENGILQDYRGENGKFDFPIAKPLRRREK